MAAWANPCVLPKLSSQLISLQLDMDSVKNSVDWPLFQLKALESLFLSGLGFLFHPEAQLPAERELPHLTTLVLSDSFEVIPLLVLLIAATRNT